MESPWWSFAPLVTDSLGNQNLSCAYTEAFLRNHGESSQPEDVVRAHCTKALQVSPIKDGILTNSA